MPSRAAAEIAATIAVGVARMIAHGQEITRIVIAWSMFRVKNQTITAIIRIVGTYQEMYRSMIRMMRDLRVLRLDDQGLDLAQRRVLAGLGDADVQNARQVARAGKDLHARHLVDRQRLARDRRLVHGAQAVDHLAVGGDVVARTHPDAVARLQLADLDLPFLAVLVEQVGLGGRQPDERLDRGAGPEGRPGLDQLAEQHEEADQPGGDVLARGERRHDAQGRQLVHVRFALDQAVDRVDDDRGPQQDRAEHGEQLGVETAGPVEDLARSRC